MLSLESIYAPFNYSTSRCYVIRLSIGQVGYNKIEHKLPVYIERVKGVFITCAYPTNRPIIGYASLNFNGQSFKSVQLVVPRINASTHCGLPFPLDEAIQPNSFLQGYFFDASNSKTFPYVLSIYIHYEPVPKP